MQFTTTTLIDATQEAVWKILTDPEMMVSWMDDPGSSIRILTSWEVGSTITIRGFHQEEFINTGIVLRYDPPNVLSYSHLSSLSKLVDVKENHSVLEFSLVELGDRTELSLTIVNFPTRSIEKHLAFYWQITMLFIKREAELLVGRYNSTQ